MTSERSHTTTLSIEQALLHAIDQQLAGRLHEAEHLYHAILKIQPHHPDAKHNLGILALQLKQPDLDPQGIVKVESYRRALEINPNNAELCNDLGNTLLNLGRIKEAAASFSRAVEINPEFAVAYCNLGCVLRELGQLDDAAKACRKSLKIWPDFAIGYCTLGNALRDLGQLDEAAASYHRALELKPDYAQAHNNLGVVQKNLGQFDNSVASYCRALEINPSFAEAHYNLGNVLNDLGKIEDAAASFCRALKIKPDYAEAHSNLGNVLKDMGQLDEAASSYRRALEFRPDFASAYSSLLYLYAFTRHIPPEAECNLAANWENIVLNEAERAAARNRAQSFDDALAHFSRAGRKLRIGVVSAEIGQHAVAEFLEPFLEQLDRQRFHLTLFPTTIKQGARQARLSVLADAFKSLVGIPDKQAADLIREDRIDVLIDTTAHMSGCRLGIFAHRAAPVQCHYIGYHGSTGLTEMDWFVADEALLPPSCDGHFREGIWRLPRLWITYRGDLSLPESRWMPSPDGTVWLGTFNNLNKVREETLSLWAKVMNTIPEARLFLKDSRTISYSIQERIRMGLARYGISAERVEFAAHVSDWIAHMSLYDRLDIALDTIPLNSGTTAFDALWMGVPLVALEGNWMGGRMSSSILKALGKPEWVARDEDEYVALVCALARDVKGRKLLRAAQRAKMAGSPLCDAKDLTRALEDAFENMFDQWLKRTLCRIPETT